MMVPFMVAMAAFVAHAVQPQADRIEVRQQMQTRVVSNSVNTLYGPAGLIIVPTARTAREGQLVFGTTFAEGVRGPSANYGITEGISVGGAFLDRDGADDKAIANAHIHIIPANFEWFEVGVGVIDAFDAIDQTFYVTGSAFLDVPTELDDEITGLRVHAGVGTGLFQERLFAGAEFIVNNRWSVIGEWDTENFNAALRYAHDQNFTVQAGFRHTNLFLGASYMMRF
jgi:hypothetical protein